MVIVRMGVKPQLIPFDLSTKMLVMQVELKAPPMLVPTEEGWVQDVVKDEKSVMSSNKHR